MSASLITYQASYIDVGVFDWRILYDTYILRVYMFRSSVGAVPPYSFGYSRVGLHWSRNNTSCIDHREVIIDERLSRTTVGASTADTFTVFLDVPRVNNTGGNE